MDPPRQSRPRRAATTSSHNTRSQARRSRAEPGPSEDPAETQHRAEDAPSRHFACPFFRKRPDLYLDCVRFALNRPGDVKQHLRRAHMFPRCPTCGLTFKDKGSEEKWHDHVSAQGCEPTDFVNRTVTDEDLGRMKLKGPSSTRGSSAEKESLQWYMIWEVLFPDDDQRPSPFHRPEHEERLAHYIETFDLDTFIRSFASMSADGGFVSGWCNYNDFAKSLFAALEYHAQVQNWTASQQVAALHIEPIQPIQLQPIQPIEPTDTFFDPSEPFFGVGGGNHSGSY
ncbi:hypothetical protein B0H67DRAFT_383991 [Lasiosphaeris hirsuta]|uniref:C2H2-type domain-containing protein n=1 Tax=Lasiosphaeris hirsuta TaxID=260670 RepID=A0AA40DJH5_9PEZI|nr:hypothetical protein B0H67DRAFT_383991 [Lasiosphaeris hirsuta]